MARKVCTSATRKEVRKGAKRMFKLEGIRGNLLRPPLLNLKLN